MRTENGFTVRTNRTIRENGLRIVNKVFQSVKESVCDYKGSFEKFVDPYGSYVRTVRTENGFTDRTNRTIREKDLRIVNTAF